MKAIVHDTYGDADVLRHEDVDRPEPGAGEVRIRVHASSVNPLDWHFMTGTPWFLRLMAGLRRPKDRRRGVDVAGVVDAVGPDVTELAVDDRVAGATSGAFAEWAIGRPKNVTKVPDELARFDDGELASIGVAGVTAIQGLRDHARLQPGQRVLVNGAAGGVGTYTVQLARTMGAHVTGVCSDRNVEMVSSIGAHEVVDYTAGDAVERLSAMEPFDVYIDNVGSHSISTCRRLLAPGGVFVMISGPKKNRLWGPVGRMIAMRLRFLFDSRRFVMFTAVETADEIRTLLGHLESGDIRPVIDRRYPLSDTPEAMRYLGTGHARAKVVIDVLTP